MKARSNAARAVRADERESGVELAAVTPAVSRVVQNIATERAETLRELRAALVANKKTRALRLARILTGLRDVDATTPR